MRLIFSTQTLRRTHEGATNKSPAPFLTGFPLLVLQPLVPLLNLLSPLPPHILPSPFPLLLLLPMFASQEERVLVVYDKPWLEERTVKSDTVTECT